MSPRKFERLFACKVMGAIFVGTNMKYHSLIVFLLKTAMVGAYYEKVFARLLQSLKEKCCGKPSQKLLPHDNAPTHTSHLAQAIVTGVQSPSLFSKSCSRDFLMFRRLQVHQRGYRFHVDNELREAVEQYFQRYNKILFCSGIGEPCQRFVSLFIGSLDL